MKKGHSQKTLSSESIDSETCISAKCPGNNFKQKVATEYAHTSNDLKYLNFHCFESFPNQDIVKERILFQTFIVLRTAFF